MVGRIQIRRFGKPKINWLSYVYESANLGFSMDQYGRKFEVLRVSVTSSCGFGCVYCAPGTASGSGDFGHSSHFLSPDLFRKNIDLLSQKISIKEIHLTGGEPTLHMDLPELVAIASKKGISNIAVTSNGFFRDGLVGDLQRSGLTRMNFSLDSISQETFSKISGKNLPVSRLLARIEEAIAAGLEVKVNCTVLKGYNEDEILPILYWAGKRGISVRYLELMKMGPLRARHSELFFSAEEIRDEIRKEFQIDKKETPIESTARYYNTSENYVFGIIANHTEPFCDGCNRLRMDSTGKIYGCLSDFRNFSLPEDEAGLEFVLDAAMKTKKTEFTGSELSMKYIGG